MKNLIGLSLVVILLVYFNAKLDLKPKSALSVIPTPTSKPFSTPIPLDSEELWSLIQNWRTSENLQTYIKDQRLCEIASDRSNDTVLDEHKGLYKKYSSYPSVLTENLVYAASAGEALSQWLKSPPHLKALRTDYKYSCLVCKAYYCVQIFSNLENQNIQKPTSAPQVIYQQPQSRIEIAPTEEPPVRCKTQYFMGSPEVVCKHSWF